MARNDRPSTSNRTSMLSRVVPAMGLVITRSSRARALTNVLLPTLRRPTIASFISGRSAVSGSSADAGGSRSKIASTRGPRLRCCFALTTIGGPKPRAENSCAAESKFGASALLTISNTGQPIRRIRWATSRSPGAIPVRTSTTKSTTAAWARPDSICRSISAVRPSGSSKPMPPVSTSSSTRPSSSIRCTSRSRVTPAVGSSIAIRFSMSQLNRLDFPTLGRPTMTTWGIMGSNSGVGRRGDGGTDRQEKPKSTPRLS